MKKHKFKFKGWDYTEIGKAIGFEHEDRDGYSQALATELWNRADGSNFTWPNGEVELCRQYIVAMLQCHAGYSAPVLKGMLQIEDDFTFMQWFCDNLGRMWT